MNKHLLQSLSLAAVPACAGAQAQNTKAAGNGEVDNLSQQSGAAFDREYMRRVGIAAHQSDIKQFEGASRSAKDPELKAWVDKTLPTLRDHLAQARKMPMPGGSSGAGSATVR